MSKPRIGSRVGARYYYRNFVVRSRTKPRPWMTNEGPGVIVRPDADHEIELIGATLRQRRWTNRSKVWVNVYEVTTHQDADGWWHDEHRAVASIHVPAKFAIQHLDRLERRVEARAPIGTAYHLFIEGARAESARPHHE